jgi:hypothetical protein
MTWAFSNVASAIEKNNSSPAAVAYPTVSAGDIIFLAMTSGPTGGSFTPADTDFVSVVTRTTNASTTLFWKVANGTESGTTNVTYSSGGQCYGQMCAFTGGPSTVSGNVHTTGNTGLGATTGLAYAGLTITQPNCLVIALGCKVGNAFGFNVPAPFDAEIAESHSSNGLCMVWDYKIQTTATTITTGNWTISTDVSASRNAVSAAFLSGPLVPSVGQANYSGQTPSVVGATATVLVPLTARERLRQFRDTMRQYYLPPRILVPA